MTVRNDIKYFMNTFPQMNTVDKDFTEILYREPVQRWVGYDDPVNDLRYLGKGSNGVAFLIKDQNKVLKITEDKSEAYASSIVQGKNIPYIVKIYKVGKYGLMYLIIQEYLPKDLNIEEQKFLDSMYSTMFEFEEDLDDTYFKSGLIDWNNKNIINKYMEYVKGDTVNPDFKDFRNSLPKHKKLFNKLMKGLASLSSLGIEFNDLHSGNVMLNSKGEVTIFDLGVSQVKRRGNIDLIERFLEDYGEIKEILK